MALKPDLNGLNIDISKQKFKHLMEVLTLLHGLAAQASCESLEEWLDSDDFDRDELEEHGATLRVEKRYYNYEWTIPLSSHRWEREYRVGLTMVIPKGKRKPSRVSFCAREWWGQVSD